ncbi:MAG: hypothetical protein KGQ51_20225, partial [Planctomycetes bacterium]|nr:hypothetical protein [Planctomycetota bacterium]
WVSRVLVSIKAPRGRAAWWPLRPAAPRCGGSSFRWGSSPSDATRNQRKERGSSFRWGLSP